MKNYDHKDIEKKWQDTWKKSAIYTASDKTDKPKQYILDMFPYPSGEGLHVGHPKGYVATDIYSRMKRMQGFNVLHPMGWDAFGLPAENYAIKNKIHPRVAVDKNIARYKEQLSIIGFDYDWSREIDTTDPAYYRWTQWIFLQLYKKGLAYESTAPINWCPSCQTGLANEDLESDGTCERCGSVVVKKPMRQWVLKITDYADRMLADLDTLTMWPAHIKEAQRNWIGRSEGVEIDFGPIRVFTTRADTLYGATYVVLAPEHELVKTLPATNRAEVDAFVAAQKMRTEIERTAEGKEKTGVRLEGVTVINPATKEEVPVWVADYVLAHYGTGGVMGVPAHDERDYAFATKYNLPIVQVVMPCSPDPKNPPTADKPIVSRDTVIVFLKNNASGKYALLDWHESLEGITTGIMGGIESGQTADEAVLAEIREEASIPNARIVRELGWLSGAEYHASHKGENRRSIARVYLAEVDDLSKQGAIPEHEAKTHSLVWVEEGEVLNRLVPVHQKFVWQQLFKKTALTESGLLMNSGEFDGMNNEEAKKKITNHVGGRVVTKYKLQDWVFSRQRYWGEPIPIIHCAEHGAVAVPESELPVLLPEVEHYEPTGTGESPLANITAWVNAPCPTCGKMGRRETNTMPQWAGSSWYWLRFMDPTNNTAPVSPAQEKYWGPVDVYVGGDHAVRHLIYARFWHKFLYDIGVVTTVEPFARLEFLGFILAEDGKKMSKRLGNIINPDDVVAQVGADAFRMYEMFMGPFENTVAWSTHGVVGVRRFLERVWRLADTVSDISGLDTITHQTIKKVSDDIETFKFNTAVSQMMIWSNEADRAKRIPRAHYEAFLKLLAPFAPHITEELWHGLGHETSIHQESWPLYDPSQLEAEMVTIAVQVNGKLRGTILSARSAHQDEVIALAKADKVLGAKMPPAWSKIVYIPGRILNIIS
ncbi:MAG: class I tRNA ligase family protein [Patescibacteria group bacterium]